MLHWNYNEFGNYALNKAIKIVTASEDVWQTESACQMDVYSCWLEFIKQDASQMMRFNWNLRYIENITTCPTYGQSLLMEQWTFLSMCEHLAHIAQTVHWASGIELCHHTLLCAIIPPFWHGILSLLGCQYSPPPSVVGSAILHPRHHPLFVSLRFGLARRQCPFLGTKYWREPHKRTNLSLFPHSRPPYSADHHGPTPTCKGYFLCICLLNTQFVWHLSNSTAWIEVEYLPL